MIQMPSKRKIMTLGGKLRHAEYGKSKFYICIKLFAVFSAHIKQKHNQIEALVIS